MSQQQQGGSEVARLKERIALEYQAACWALDGLAEGTAKHWFITRRYEQIDTHREALNTLIGERETMRFIVQVTENSPAQREGAAHD